MSLLCLTSFQSKQVAQTYNPCAPDAEAGGSRIKGQLGLLMCETLSALEREEMVTQTRASNKGEAQVGCLSTRFCTVLLEPLVASQTKSHGLMAVLWGK